MLALQLLHVLPVLPFEVRQGLRQGGLVRDLGLRVRDRYLVGLPGGLLLQPQAFRAARLFQGRRLVDEVLLRLETCPRGVRRCLRCVPALAGDLLVDAVDLLVVRRQLLQVGGLGLDEGGVGVRLALLLFRRRLRQGVPRLLEFVGQLGVLVCALRYLRLLLPGLLQELQPLLRRVVLLVVGLLPRLRRVTLRLRVGDGRLPLPLRQRDLLLRYLLPRLHRVGRAEDRLHQVRQPRHQTGERAAHRLDDLRHRVPDRLEGRHRLVDGVHIFLAGLQFGDYLGD